MRVNKIECLSFSVSLWVFIGMLIALGFVIMFMTILFTVSSVMYWLEVKRILVIDAILWR